MMNEKHLQKIIKSVRAFKIDAHNILSKHEDASSRVVTLGSTYKALKILNVKQDDLFRQALTCTEKNCFRAAHVMAWSAFMDYLEEKFFEDGGLTISRVRPKWNASSAEELREEVNDFQLIEAIKDLKLGSKSEVKALHGLLNKRNECAHPSSYYPELNDTLGYISELLQRLKNFSKKTVK